MDMKKRVTIAVALFCFGLNPFNTIGDVLDNFESATVGTQSNGTVIGDFTVYGSGASVVSPSPFKNGCDNSLTITGSSTASYIGAGGISDISGSCKLSLLVNVSNVVATAGGGARFIQIKGTDNAIVLEILLKDNTTHETNKFIVSNGAGTISTDYLTHGTNLNIVISSADLSSGKYDLMIADIDNGTQLANITSLSFKAPLTGIGAVFAGQMTTSLTVCVDNISISPYSSDSLQETFESTSVGALSNGTNLGAFTIAGSNTSIINPSSFSTGGNNDLNIAGSSAMSYIWAGGIDISDSFKLTFLTKINNVDATSGGGAKFILIKGSDNNELLTLYLRDNSNHATNNFITTNGSSTSSTAYIAHGTSLKIIISSADVLQGTYNLTIEDVVNGTSLVELTDLSFKNTATGVGTVAIGQCTTSPLSVSIDNILLEEGQQFSKGHRILLDRGLQIQALCWPTKENSPYIETGLNLEQFAEGNFTTINLKANSNCDDYLGDVADALAWARWIVFDTLEELETNELPYLPNLVSMQVSDELDLDDPDVLADVIEVTARLQEAYPDVIIHTDSGGRQFDYNYVLANYMWNAKPDMVMVNSYPFDGGVASTFYGSARIFYYVLQKYRQLGLAGNNGLGDKPIPAAFYLQTHEGYFLEGHTISESEMRLNQFAGWVFGFKFACAFTYDSPYAPDPLHIPSALFDGCDDSSPTDQFDQLAETNRQSLNLGPALIRLISTDVRMVMGEHVEIIDQQPTVVINVLPPFGSVLNWQAGYALDPYIKAISASNSGGKNDELRGDVIIGYFKPLDWTFVESGYENDIYFMIVNGLSDVIGNASECTQDVRLDFDFTGTNITSLLRLSRNTGIIETVPLVSDGNGLYHVVLTLEGGTGDLFKFNNGGKFVSDPSLP